MDVYEKMDSMDTYLSSWSILLALGWTKYKGLFFPQYSQKLK